MSVPTQTILSQVYGDFPQSLQQNSGTVPRKLGHDHFLARPLQLIIH